MDAEVDLKMYASQQYVAVQQSTAVGRCIGFQLRLDDAFGSDWHWGLDRQPGVQSPALGSGSTRLLQMLVASNAVFSHVHSL